MPELAPMIAENIMGLHNRTLAKDYIVVMSDQSGKHFSAIEGAIGNEEFLTLLDSETVKVQRSFLMLPRARRSSGTNNLTPSGCCWFAAMQYWSLRADERLELNEGDYLAIPPHARHRVDETGQETIWLVVHLTDGA